MVHVDGACSIRVLNRAESSSMRSRYPSKCSMYCSCVTTALSVSSPSGVALWRSEAHTGHVSHLQGLEVLRDSLSAWLWCLSDLCTILKSNGCNRVIQRAATPSGSLKLRSQVRLARSVTTVKCRPVNSQQLRPYLWCNIASHSHSVF